MYEHINLAAAPQVTRMVELVGGWLLTLQQTIVEDGPRPVHLSAKITEYMMEEYVT